ncbi:MAG: pyridoxamine 5'-phosphate oxidase family protein [Nakamurella sp.]
MFTSTERAAAESDVIAAYRTCEFATVTRSGTPIAWPIAAWQRPDGSFLVTTSIGLPQKALNIRRTPAVAMLFSDATASGLTDPPQILIQGTATCPDEIVTDAGTLPEYWMQLMRRQPSSKMISSLVGRRLMGFYYLRLIITVTPTTVSSRPAVRPEAPLSVPVLPKSARTTPFGQALGRLPDFRSGVLAAFDDAGRPVLQRVVPDADISTTAMLLDVPDGVHLRPGPASLLCHSHDNELAAQNSFVVAGTLERRGDRWALTTERFIPGPGTGGPLAMVKAIQGMRRAAQRYLDRRGLPRPTVKWSAIDELWRQANATDSPS